MKELTKAEEQVMQVLWKIGEGFVRDILEEFSGSKPAYNTVSTIVRILERKGFVDYKSYGKAHQYYPLVSKESYKRYFTGNLLENYFEGSAESLLSFFVKENKLDLKDLEDIIHTIKKNDHE